MKRAALYARYSSDNQRHESIDAQLRASREYCASRNYAIVRIYTDEAITGTSVVRRDAFQKMILDSGDDIFDVVIFHKIDRNARDEIDYYTNVDRLRKNGVTYEYSAEGIDVSTTNGKLTEGIKVAVAAWYSRNLATEVKKGQKENALKGIFNGGRPPLGYKIVNQRYEIEPREAEAVRLIFDMYIHGNGYVKIASELNRRGFTTRNGKPFVKNSLYEILGNERYTGTYIFNRICTDEFGRRNNHKINPDAIRIENAIPAIIDKETFKIVAELRARNKNCSSRFRAVETYLLSGKVKCALCGSPMNGHRVKCKTGTYSYYCCSKTRLPKDVKCAQKLISKTALEKKVANVIMERILSESVRPKLFEEMKNYYQMLIGHSEKERHTLNVAKAAAETKLSNLYALVEAGNVIDKFDIMRIQKVKAEITDITNQLNNIPKTTNLKLPDEETFNKILKEMHSALLRDDKEVMEMIINNFVSEVEIGPNYVHIYIETKGPPIFSAKHGSLHLHHSYGYTLIKCRIPRTILCKTLHLNDVVIL